jgi:TolB-like protein
MSPVSERPSIDPKIYEFGEFRLDVAERTLIGPDGVSRQLRSRPMAVLLYMLERPGQLLPKGTLLEEVWRGVVVEENSLTQAISWLRRELENPDRDRRYIETVPSVGYRFVEKVKEHGARNTIKFAEPTSLAVLAFGDLSSGGDQQYLADGVAEEILNRLMEIPGLRVIARASSFVFRGGTERPSAIGAELGAQHLLTGTVRRNGSQLRIAAQLVHAATGEQIWADRYDRRLEDIFAMQDDIAAAVAASVRLNLGDVEQRAGGTSHVAAHEIYLRARYVSRQMGGREMVRGMELYREALALDPNYVLAWLGLAETCRGLLVFVPERAAEAARMLHEAADRALALAPHFWGSHVVDTWRLGYTRDWCKFERALASARELARGVPPDLRLARAIFCAQVGRLQAAAEEARALVRDDPLSPLSSNILQMDAHCAGYDDEAEAEYERSRDLKGSRQIRDTLALLRALWVKNDTLIEDRFTRLLEDPASTLPVLEDVFKVRRDPDRAQALLRAAANATYAQNARVQMSLAWWLGAYGDGEGALAAARRAQLELPGGLPSWLWFPCMREARVLPGFKNLVEQLGLVDYWRVTGNWGDFCEPLGDNDFVRS